LRRIPIEQLHELFHTMKEELDVEGDLLWGYFFTDPDKKKLAPLRDELVRSGYQEVALYRTDDKKTYFLHVEKVERHTPASLHERNDHFYALADRFGIESYDGMDVGAVDDDEDED
jgi:regulator of ribonuclease activity B